MRNITSLTIFNSSFLYRLLGFIAFTVFALEGIAQPTDIRDNFTFGAIATPYNPANFDSNHKYEVTNTLTDGSIGSLTWAMNSANASSETDPILIYFNIPGQAPHEINSSVGIYHANVIIDGWTQPANGYGGNSPKIKIVSSNSSWGISMNDLADDIIIQGLEIDFVGNASGSPIYISGNVANNININTNVIYSTSNPSLYGIRVLGGITNSVIQGNIIGADASYNYKSPFSDGIYFDIHYNGNVCTNNLIGGEDYDHGNLIMNVRRPSTSQIGVYIVNFYQANIIQDNIISHNIFYDLDRIAAIGFNSAFDSPPTPPYDYKLKLSGNLAQNLSNSTIWTGGESPGELLNIDRYFNDGFISGTYPKAGAEIEIFLAGSSSEALELVSTTTTDINGNWGDNIIVPEGYGINVTGTKDGSSTSRFVFETAPACNSVPDDIEYQVLVDIYNSTHGTNWQNIPNPWNTGLDPSTVTSADFENFTGVTIVGGDIVHIILNSKNMTGTLPSSVKNLCKLRTLRFTGSSINGAIPDEYGSLLSLTSLQLYDNNLTGSIPASLGDLVNLEILDLKENQLTGTIPSEFNHLENLETLDLSSNNLSGTIPDFDGMVSLSFLDLKFNNFNTIPELELPQLETLIFRDNNLSGNIPNIFSSLPSLESIDLSNNNLTGPLPSSLMGNTSISYIRLDNNSLSGSLPLWLNTLSNLSSFYANNNHFNGELTSQFSGPSIRQVYLSNNDLSGSIPSSFFNELPYTTALRLDGNNFDNISLSFEFSHNTSFNTVWDIYNNFLDFQDLENFLNARQGSLSNYFLNYVPQHTLTSEAIHIGLIDTELTIPFSTPGSQNSYQWQKNIGSWSSLSGEQNPSLVFATLLANDGASYRNRVSNILVSGLELYSGEYHVIVVSGNFDICTGQTSVITANGPGTFEWFDVASGGSAIATGSTFNATNAGTYYVEATVNGVTSTRTQFTIGSLDATADVGLDLYVCTPEANLAATGNYVDGSWSLVSSTPPGLTASFVGGDNTLENVTVNLDGGAGAYTFEWLANGQCNTATDQVVVTYGTFQDVDFTHVGNCDGTFTLTAAIVPSTALPFAYKWFYEGNEIVGESNASITASAYGDYEVGATYLQCTVNGLINDVSLVNDWEEYQVLVALYNSTAEVGWTTSTNWNTGLTQSQVDATVLNSFYGVTVVDGDITSIDLGNNNLVGTIPSQISGLCGLETLILNNNQLTGPIPDVELSTISSLSWLDLANNNFTGNLPLEIGNISGLTHLDLSNNTFDGAFLTSIGNLVNLDYLDISNNQITGQVPANLAYRSLSTVNLGSNNLISFAPQYNSTTNFTTFDVSDNQFDFGDLEPFFTGPSTTNLDQYTPQTVLLSSEQTVIMVEGANQSASFITGGSQNVYQWQKFDGSTWQNATGQTGADLNFTSVSSTDYGTYRNEVTNAWATGLTLYSGEANVVTVSGDLQVCSGGVAVINVNGADSYEWYSVQFGGSPLVSPVFTEGTYYLEATVDGVASSRTPVSVGQFPTQNPVITTSDPVNYCPGDPISTTLSIFNDPGYTYQWFRTYNSVTTELTGETTYQYTATDIGDYHVEVTSPDGCLIASNPFVIQLFSGNVTSNAGPDLLICDGDVDLNASGNYTSGAWVVVSVPAAFPSAIVTFLPSVNDPNATASFSDPGQYELAWDVMGDCTGQTASDNLLVTWDQNFTASILATLGSGGTDPDGDIEICMNESFTLSADLTPGGLSGALTYVWYKDGSPTPWSSGQTVAGEGPGEYRVVISTNGCSREAIANVSTKDIASGITIDVTESTTDLCPGSSLTLNVPGGYSAYQWKLDGVDIAGAVNSSHPATLAGDYSMILTDETGCSDETSALTINELETLTFAIDATEETTCLGSSDGEVEFRILGNIGPSDPIVYEVRTQGGVLVTSSSSGVVNSVVIVSNLYAGQYVINATHPLTGCTSSQVFNILYGGPELTYSCLSSVSCSPTIAETSSLSFTIERSKVPITGNYDYTIVGSGGYNSGVLTGSFGVQQNDVASLPYGQTYQIMLAPGQDNTCTIDFDLEPPTTNLTVSTGLASNKFVICEGTTTDVNVSAILETTLCTVAPDLDKFEVSLDLIGTGVVATETFATSPFSFEDLSVGNYQVTVTPSNASYANCSEIISFSISESTINATVSVTDATCAGLANGAAVANVSGGYPPYNYVWKKNGSIISTLPSAANLLGTPGNNSYQLEVFDQVCTQPAIVDFTVNEPTPLGTVTIIPPTQAACDVWAELSPAGGVGPYTFTWKKLETVVISRWLLPDQTVNTEVIKFVESGVIADMGVATSVTTTNEIEPGDYIVEVTDANSCKVESAPVYIEQPKVARTYELCIRWVTRAEQVEQQDPQDVVINMTGITSLNSAAGVKDQAEQCLEEGQASIDLAYYNYCLSGEYLNDEVSLKYHVDQYHHTLYYFDRGGRLVRTVPPAGVSLLTGPNLNRATATTHSMITRYDYDNWGQLSRQQSPDGGLTNFSYNLKGQLRYSQNAKQLTEGTFAFSKYDRLGRIRETGKAELGQPYTAPDATVHPTASFADLQNEDLLGVDEQDVPISQQFPVAAHNPSEVTQTIFSELSGEQYYGEDQQNLRNRVSYTETVNKDGSVASTHYSYDPHGNVKWLVQDVPGLNRNYLGYEYELISGNVTLVKLNEQSMNPFYHRYEYDEDNRITKAMTSGNGVIWEHDGSYEYYDHGPLKRMTVGQDKVQGLDYAYTLQGWLKGVNHPTLDPVQDLGGDGLTNTTGQDVFGMELGYFAGDFENTGSPYDVASVNRLPAETGYDLYNGNISSWASRVETPSASLQYEDLSGFTYRYDELNRIKSASFHSNPAGTWNAESDFEANFSYDGNGNLLSLERKAFGALEAERSMDDLTYNYISGTNKLGHVDDAVASSTWLTDVEDQDVSNYTYDEIGNLTSDVAENITAIDWTLYGKVGTITHQNGDEVSFVYDASGNRIRKRFIHNAGGTDETYYVRDASGNVMAIYEGDGVDTQLKELSIYGSDRMGRVLPPEETTMVVEVSGTESVSAFTGQSYILNSPGDAVILGPGFSTGGETFYAISSASVSEILELQPSYLHADANVVRRIGHKQYELKDHLGNVRAVVSDRKFTDFDGSSFSNYRAELLTASGYYPFGMEMPGMNYNSNTYRYGFNGKEKDQSGEWGTLTHYDYGFRIYNPGIAKFLSVDPLSENYAFYSPFSFAGNTPIQALDLDGLEILNYKSFYLLDYSKSKIGIFYFANPITSKGFKGGQPYAPAYFYRRGISLKSIPIAGGLMNFDKKNLLVIQDRGNGDKLVVNTKGNIWEQNTSASSAERDSEKILRYNNNLKPGQLNAIAALIENAAKEIHVQQRSEYSDAINDINQTLNAVKLSFEHVNRAIINTDDKILDRLEFEFGKELEQIRVDLVNYVLDGGLPGDNKYRKPDTKYDEYIINIGTEILESIGSKQGLERESMRLDGKNP